MQQVGLQHEPKQRLASLPIDNFRTLYANDLVIDVFLLHYGASPFDKCFAADDDLGY